MIEEGAEMQLHQHTRSHRNGVKRKARQALRKVHADEMDSLEDTAWDKKTSRTDSFPDINAD